MDIEERIRRAKEVLGKTARIIGKKDRQKTRPVSEFVPRNRSKNRNMSQKEFSECGKKTRYNSEADAKKYAARLSRLRGYGIRVYYCHWCNGFHMTHKVHGENAG